MAVNIHPTAIINPLSKLGDNIEIGPYAVIEDNVEIGDNSVIGCHARIAWGTRIGRNCRIFNGASVGTIPQDLKFAGEETTLEIGDNTIIREFCTLNRGTSAAGKTVIGNNCALLAYCHVAHDCIVGNNVIASNSIALAGHVTVGDHVTFGGFVTVHQFSRIGDFAFLQSGCRILRDIIPFALVGGSTDSPILSGINKVGLERNGYDEARRTKIKRIFKMLFRNNMTVQESLTVLDEQYPSDEDALLIINFIKQSQRGIIRMNEE